MLQHSKLVMVMNLFSRINPQQVRERLNNLQSVGEQISQVAAIYLFGSFYRGRENEWSDVDIAVLLTDISNEVKNSIENALLSLLAIDEVDTVFLDEAPLEFVKEILLNSKRIFCQDCNWVAEFEATAMLSYLDFEPYLRLYSQTQLERIRKGGLGKNVYQTRPATLAH
jgi:predicted nucleotidyltransferase